MGHLNVGFYVAKAMEALGGLAAELGMPQAFSPRAEATIVLREQHVRFMREAHVGGKLHIDGGVLELGEDDARLLFLMRHGDGELAAAFQMRVVHATAREGRPFPWPERARRRAEQLRIDLPEKAAPRSVPLGPLESAASLARALELGLTRTSRGLIRPAECDAFGRMGAQALMARVSDCVTHIASDLLAEVCQGAAGGVVLEYRFIYLGWPRVGDHLEIRSGWSGAEPRLRHMVHWLVDPVGGRAWAAAEAVLAAFDTEARRMIVLDEAQLALWRERVVPDLRI
jgi:acyl-CoA thioester hydrolase